MSIQFLKYKLSNIGKHKKEEECTFFVHHDRLISYAYFVDLNFWYCQNYCNASLVHWLFKDVWDVFEVFADLASINVLRSTEFLSVIFIKSLWLWLLLLYHQKKKLNVKIGTLKKFAHFSLSRQLTDQKTNKALNQNFLLSQKWS